MLSSHFELRTLIFLDSLQPQLCQLISKQNSVYDPSTYDASLVIEICPAMEIHRMIDLALKATKVRLGEVVTERHFGLMEVHHADQGEVKEAGNAILRELGLDENDRQPIEILANKIIRGVEQDHAVMFSNIGRGNMVLPDESVFILEAAPAAYLTIACNEALKAANIKLIHMKAFGATGRLIMSGKEADIDSAVEAAETVIERLNQMQISKSGSQLY